MNVQNTIHIIFTHTTPCLFDSHLIPLHELYQRLVSVISR